MEAERECVNKHALSKLHGVFVCVHGACSSSVVVWAAWAVMTTISQACLALAAAWEAWVACPLLTLEGFQVGAGTHVSCMRGHLSLHALPTDMP